MEMHRASGGAERAEHTQEATTLWAAEGVGTTGCLRCIREGRWTVATLEWTVAGRGGAEGGRLLCSALRWRRRAVLLLFPSRARRSCSLRLSLSCRPRRLPDTCLWAKDGRGWTDADGSEHAADHTRHARAVGGQAGQAVRPGTRAGAAFVFHRLHECRALANFLGQLSR